MDLSSSNSLKMSTSRDVSGWVGKRAPIARVVRVVITEPEMELAAEKPVEAETVSTPVKAEKASGGKFVPVHMRPGYKVSAASASCPSAPTKKSREPCYAIPERDEYDEDDSTEARWYRAQGNYPTLYEAGTNVMPYSEYWSEWAVAQREYNDRIRLGSAFDHVRIAGPASGAGGGAGVTWEAIGGYRKTSDLPPDDEPVRKSKKKAVSIKHDEADDADDADE